MKALKTTLFLLASTCALAQSPFAYMISDGVPELEEADNMRGSYFNLEAYNRLGTANEDDLNEKVFIAGEVITNFPIRNLGNLAAGSRVSIPLAGDFRQVTVGAYPWLILKKSDRNNIGVLYSGLTYTIRPSDTWENSHKKVELSGGIEYITNHGKQNLPIIWSWTIYAEHNNAFQVLSWGTKPRNMWGIDMSLIFTPAADLGLKFKAHVPHHGLEEFYLGIVTTL